jgi:hypothetical protein
VQAELGPRPGLGKRGEGPGAAEVGVAGEERHVGQLIGDLNGTILFNPTSVFDFANGTLLNTGTQFFSGTAAGSEPVILYDDSFRFEIDLTTGATLGTVHLSRSIDAPTRAAGSSATSSSRAQESRPRATSHPTIPGSASSAGSETDACSIRISAFPWPLLPDHVLRQDEGAHGTAV